MSTILIGGVSMKIDPKTTKFVLDLVIAIASAASTVIVKHYFPTDV